MTKAKNVTNTLVTGYFARATENGHRAAHTKVHLVNGSIALCGYMPHPSMKLQSCANFAHLPYVECQSCIDKYNNLRGITVPKPKLEPKLSELPLKLKSVKKLKHGDVFLWQSGISGRYELHTFHSDAGYGAKTYTEYNTKDGSSMVVNYSGILGVVVVK